MKKSRVLPWKIRTERKKKSPPVENSLERKKQPSPARIVFVQQKEVALSQFLLRVLLFKFLLSTPGTSFSVPFFCLPLRVRDFFNWYKFQYQFFISGWSIYRQKPERLVLILVLQAEIFAGQLYDIFKISKYASFNNVKIKTGVKGGEFFCRMFFNVCNR